MELHTYLEGMDRLSAPRKSIPVTKCDFYDVDLAVSSLQRHKKIVHKLNIGKQIQCPECEKLFQSKDRLIMHLAKSHALSTPDYTMFSCAECNYKSNSKAYLSFHKKRMHTARPGLWMCMAGACKEKPRSFLNQHQKHQQDHANVNCSVRNKSFSAKRNLKRHMKTVHKAVEMDVSRNSNNSNPDNNLNEQDEIINNATFLMDPLLWLAFNLPTFMDYLYKISTMIKINWHFDI